MDESLYLKSPADAARPAGPDPAVVQRVSEMLARIEREGIDAVRAYSRELDDWDPPSFEVGPDEVADASASLPESLKDSIAFAQAQITNFARRQRATLTDFETETLPAPPRAPTASSRSAGSRRSPRWPSGCSAMATRRRCRGPST